MGQLATRPTEQGCGEGIGRREDEDTSVIHGVEWGCSQARLCTVFQITNTHMCLWCPGHPVPPVYWSLLCRSQATVEETTVCSQWEEGWLHTLPEAGYPGKPSIFSWLWMNKATCIRVSLWFIPFSYISRGLWEEETGHMNSLARGTYAERGPGWSPQQINSPSLLCHVFLFLVYQPRDTANSLVEIQSSALSNLETPWPFKGNLK